MSNPHPLTVQTLVNHLDYLLEKVKETIHEAEGLRQTKDYLSQRLTESHQYSSRLLSERNTFQVQYEVLRDVCLTFATSTWPSQKAEAFTRMQEVLGLTPEGAEVEEEAPAPYTLPFTPDNDEDTDVEPQSKG